MKCLVIGGSGHVSGAVSRAAVVQGHEVWVVTRGQRPLPEGVVGLQADRHDARALRAVVSKEGIAWDVVLDCIGYEPEDIAQDIEVFSATAKHLIFVSTDFVYDPPRRRFPQPEDGAALPVEGDHILRYGQHKRRCELRLMDTDTGDMQWTIVRPCHVYGPTSQLGCLPLHGRDPDLIRELRAGETLRLVGGGHFLQQPILARDLAGAILGMALNERCYGQILNLAGPDIVESRMYYQIVADILGVGLTVEEAPVDAYLAENPDKASHCCHRIYDLSRLRASTASPPATPLEQGLREHVEGLLAAH